MPRYAYEAGCEVVICRHHRELLRQGARGGGRSSRRGRPARSRARRRCARGGAGGNRGGHRAAHGGAGLRRDAGSRAPIWLRSPRWPTAIVLPVIVDAANQVPPLENLKRFIAEGADLVAMSGGKAFRGPQSSGILFGRRDLVASALLQQLDMDMSPSAWTPPKEFVDRPLTACRGTASGAASRSARKRSPARWRPSTASPSCAAAPIPMTTCPAR